MSEENTQERAPLAVGWARIGSGAIWCGDVTDIKICSAYIDESPSIWHVLFRSATREEDIVAHSREDAELAMIAIACARSEYALKVEQVHAYENRVRD